MNAKKHYHALRARLFMAILLALLLAPAHAGLLTERTRIIYQPRHDGYSLLIANINNWPVLVQPWVDHGEGDLEHASAPFVVIPAIFRLEPHATQVLRIIHTGEALPDNQESLFWLNLYEIPPTTADTGADDTAADAEPAKLTLTITTQLKLIYRPENVDAPTDLAAQLTFTVHEDTGRWSVLAHNPTPWNASLSALSVDGSDGPLPAETTDLLLPPFTTRRYRLSNGQPGSNANIHFNLIDDSGFSQTYHQSLVLP